MNKVLAASFILGIFITISCNNGSDKPVDTYNPPKTPAIAYSIANSFAHDTSYFTEGLEFYKGKLVESTGSYGKFYFFFRLAC